MKSEETEKNPLKIVWIARKNLLPKSIWKVFISVILLIWILDNFVPDSIVRINYSAVSLDKFIVLSVSALAFILSMFTFGRETYSMNDFSDFFVTRPKVYYEYLADYLFPSFLWFSILIMSVTRLIIILTLPDTIIHNLKLFYLSVVFLALITTMTVIIRNMNRFTNKVVMQGKRDET